MINCYIVRIKRLGLFVACTASILATGGGVALAQHFFHTEWSEEVAFCGVDACKGVIGSDSRAPEPLTADLSGQNWGFDGEVTYGPPGPPSISISLNAQYESGFSSGLVGRVSNAVIFQFRLRQKGSPPQAVDYVPLTIRMKGAAAVTGGPLTARAQVNLGFDCCSGAVWGLSGDARGTNDPYNPPTSASLDKTYSYGLRPGTVISGLMLAHAYMEGVPRSGGSTHATASIEMAIEVADQLILGTSTNYRDVYEIEFSPGFFALDPVAVQGSTWSAVKSLYRGVHQ